MSKFEWLAENISGIDYNNNRYGECDANGISAWYCESEYDNYIKSGFTSEPIDIIIDGVHYSEHWFFVNELHESSVAGYSLLSDDHDVKFCVVGNRTDFVCDFDTMYSYLTDSKYFY